MRYQRCSKKVFRVLLVSLKNVSRIFKGCFNRNSSGVQGCLKEVQWVFEENFKGVSRMLQGRLGVFLESFEGDSWELQGYLKEVQGSFKDI